MRLKWPLRAGALLLVAGLTLGVARHEEIARLMAVNSLFDEDRIVANFSSMQTMFHTTRMDPGPRPPSPLPEGRPEPLPDAARAWMEDRAVTSLLVLRGGRIVHETYRLGTGPDDLRISWSVAKSWLSVLLGIVIDEGAIASLDAPVTDYAPALAGSAYDGATIRDVAMMSSGVAFDEDYAAFNSDINRMGRTLALGGSMDAFTAALDTRAAAPGTDWAYVSTDTHVLGMVIRGATGRPIAGLMEEKVIRPLRLERAPLYLTDAGGTAFVLGGLNMTTRDYARFGQMILQRGEWQGRRIVPAAWLDTATRPHAPTAEGEKGYGYQFWIPQDGPPGEVTAEGIYGQYIYVNRPRDTVIVMTAADRNFGQDGRDSANIRMLRRIAEGG